MPAPSATSVSAAERIAALLPSLVRSLNADEQVPWIDGLGIDDFTAESLAAALTMGTGWNASARHAARAMEGQPLHADRSDTKAHAIFFEVQDGRILALIHRYVPESDSLGLAIADLSAEGQTDRIEAAPLHGVGEPLKQRSDRQFFGLLSTLAAIRLLTDAADPGDDPAKAASGISAMLLDGVTVYEHKDALDSDSEHQDRPIQIVPRALPKVRSDVAKELNAFGARFGLDEKSAAYSREIGQQVEDAQEQWWVDEDMAKLAWDVTVSGTGPEDLSEAELPSPSGIMWLNGGGGPALLTKEFPGADYFQSRTSPSELLSINAILWYTPRSSHGIRGLEPGVTRFMGLSASPELARDTAAWGGVLSPLDIESDLIENFRMPTYVTTGMLKGLPRTMALTVMRLSREESLGQSTSEQVVPLGGGKKAKGKKAKAEPATITVASLRRRRYESDAEREAESRQFTHRWIVRGHMRNQAIGPRNAEGGQQHTRVWIAPYVKGPEDKPLVLKDRVQVWRR